MTADTSLTSPETQTLEDLQQEISNLSEAWESFKHSVACERQSHFIVIQELVDTLSFVLEEADHKVLEEAFWACEPGRGERWIAQAQGLLRAVDSLRRNVPQYATPPQEPKP